MGMGRRSRAPGGNGVRLVLKWVGAALLVLACLLAVYLGAGLLGELAVWATYP
jgi:hypothetical protein